MTCFIRSVSQWRQSMKGQNTQMCGGYQCILQPSPVVGSVFSTIVSSAEQNFSMEFFRDSWLPSQSKKRQACKEEAKLTPARLCGLQLLETIWSPSVFAINRCKYLCVSFFVLGSESDGVFLSFPAVRAENTWHKNVPDEFLQSVSYIFCLANSFFSPLQCWFKSTTDQP